MPEYFVKSTADAQVQGPLTGAELKRRAAAGEIARDALVSTDTTTWHPAGRVKGLFPAAARANADAAGGTAVSPPPEQHDFVAPPVAPFAAPPAAPTAPRPRPPRRIGLPPAYPGTTPMTFGRSSAPAAPPPEAESPALESPDVQPHEMEPTEIEPPDVESPDVESPDVGSLEAESPALHDEEDVLAAAQPPPPLPRRGVMPPSLGYATPGVTGQQRIRPRKTIGFLIIAVLMLVVGLVHAYEIFVSITDRSPDSLDILLLLGSNLLWLLLSAGALALWLLWLGGVHKDMQILSAGQYPVSPAKAIGFSFIPIFNAFWAVFAPSKLAGTVNEKLDSIGQPRVARAAVVACQIISVAAPLFGLYALTPLMYAVSMRIVQGGLNRLAAQHAT